MVGTETTEPRAIDKSIPTPLYFQLLQILKGQIESGALAPGHAIPTERVLMERYGISRPTVRQAILQLVRDGYLRREKAKGTFVLPPPGRFRFMEGLGGFSTEMTRRGIPYSSKVLQKKVLKASEKVAQRLDIELGALVLYLKRLRIVNGRPLLIDVHYVPYSLCQGIENKLGDDVSLYSLLANDYGVDLHHGWREFEPVLPSSREDMDLLGIHANTGILYVESVVYNRQGSPVDYFENKIHGKFIVDTVNTGTRTQQEEMKTPGRKSPAASG